MVDLKTLLEISSQNHSHLCPRQILGVRLGLCGLHVMGFDGPPANKHLLTIVETDGCFADGVIAATGCRVGNRTLRVEDYGKTAAVFIDTRMGWAIRVSPVLDIRERAQAFVPDEPRHYFAQMRAYQTMPDAEMFITQNVALNVPVEQIISRPGVRVNCDMCGEEIINGRETHQDDLILCQSCAHGGYYHPENPERQRICIARTEEVIFQ